MKSLLLSLVSLAVSVFAYGQCPNPPFLTLNINTNSCGDQVCVTPSVIGGTAPFTFQLSNGQTLTPNGTCISEEGNYFIMVIDANGCAHEQLFTVDLAETINNTCENATSLQNGVVVQDTLCSLQFNTPTCTPNLNFYQSGWYQINSEDYSHLAIGFSGGYNSSPGTIQGGAVEVFASATGDCATMELVHCANNTTCFDLADEITILPNTTYFIHAMAAWTSFVPVEIVAVLSNEPTATFCGCTNTASCNYDPSALIDNGSCGWNGCMDASACNYLSYATCDDGSCIYGNDLTGQVFHDVNGNGTRDLWPIAEPLLGNLGSLQVNELNTTIYPDASGSFVLPGLALGTYTLTFTDPSNLWSLENGNTISVTLPTCSGLPIALVPVSGATAQVSTYINGNTIIQCNNGFNPSVWISNTGSTNISGTLTLTMDPSLVPNVYSGAVGYASASNGVITWNINNQNIGAGLNYGLHVNGPGATFVGTVYPFTWQLTLSDGTTTFYENTWSFNGIVTCAYDPNDKQAEPAGYAEPHYILADTEIEYRIRFQNTGNAPAFDVRIDDQIDISKLDLATFQPTGASHSYSTLVDPNGFVQFVFNNIMLPDSGLNEPASHGFVTYRIKAKPELQHGDQILNTAEIYFDDNPAIITNTTLHTIFDCATIPSTAVNDEFCLGEDMFFAVTDEYIENYVWSLNNIETDIEENTFTVMSSEPNTYSVSCEISNPLCEATRQWTVDVNPVPGDMIYFLDAMFIQDGVQWQWYFDGNVIDGATEQSFGGDQTGYYTVYTTNEFGCSTMSQPFYFIGLEEISGESFDVYPNPAIDFIQINRSSSDATQLEIINSMGQVVQSELLTQETTRITLSPALAKGIYLMQLKQEGKVVGKKAFVIGS